jgi:LysR family transcriptional regulator, regulator for bpeEF and oprC
MDKLRALNYFVACAEAGSFAGAARRLELSVPAVHKLVAALERSLGVPLFERSVQGLTLTSGGASYLEICQPLLQELSAADRALSRSAEQLSGTLAVAIHSQLANHVLLPVLPRFHARHPEIQIDLRVINRLSDADAVGADVWLLHGWPEANDLVQRQFSQSRLTIVAAPAYWSAAGVPQHPSELERHTCLLLRNPAGILLDLWEFERGPEKLAVKVGGWLCSTGREVLLDAVLAGEGVARFTRLTSTSELQSGRLVPVLLDWDVKGGPPVNLLYRQQGRRTPRVRAFIDFVTALMRELEAGDDGAAARPGPELPYWHRRGQARASSVLRRARS